MIKFDAFTINDLFESSNGNFDIQQQHLNNTGYYVVSSGLQNHGIIGKTDIKARIFDKNTITIDMFGNAFFRDFKYKMVTHARVFSLKYKHKNLNREEGLYFAVAFKYLQKIFSYNNMATWEKIKNLKIILPVDNKKEINFKYIKERMRELEEERMRELEEERMRELSAYLKTSNLENYNLTDDEKDIIKQLNEDQIIYSKFKIGDLFEIHPTKSYGLTNDKLFKENGSTPVVVNSSVSNGIGGYANLPATEIGNMITFSDTTTDSAIFYQPDDFIGYSHVQGLYPKYDIIWSEKALLYFLTLFKKCAKGRFDYATKFNRAIAAQMEIELPVKNGKINFEFMEKFINIQQKLAIKSVVDWRDKEIQTTKHIVNF